MYFNKSEALLAHPQINPIVLLILPPEEAKYQVDHIQDNRAKEAVASQIICLSIGFISVFLRFVSRRIIKAKFKADDFLVLISLIFTTIFISLVLVCVYKYGAGRHAILLSHPIRFAQAALAAELTYGVAITAVKVSMALLLGRIFPSHKLHRVLWVIGGLVVLYWLPITIVTIFQCRPIKAAWDLDPSAQCIDVKMIWAGCSALHAATDLALIVAPMPFVWRLQVPISTKISLMGLFCVGGFVTVVSAYRVSILKQVSLDDGSWTNVDPCIWTAVEVNLAIFCACAVTFRPVLSAVFGVRQPSAGSGEMPSFIRSPRYGRNTWARLWRRRSRSNDDPLPPHNSSRPSPSSIDLEFKTRKPSEITLVMSVPSDDENWQKGSAASSLRSPSRFQRPSTHTPVLTPAAEEIDFVTGYSLIPPPPPHAWTKPRKLPGRKPSNFSGASRSTTSTLPLSSLPPSCSADFGSEIEEALLARGITMGRRPPHSDTRDCSYDTEEHLEWSDTGRGRKPSQI